MSWAASIFVALLTGAAALFASAYVANQAVDWYSVSSFEGGSGYFMIALAILGGIIGFVLGLVISRVVANTADPGFFKALGLSLLVSAVALGVTGGIARLRADVGPEIDGEKLLLAVEVRYPAAYTGPSPATDTSTRFVRLGSLTGGNVQRASDRGPLWMEDAHQVEGRWVVPGAVEVFTSRGKRVLDVMPDSVGHGEKVVGVMVPLRAWPRESDMEWTEWMPRANKGAAPLPDGFQFRYRVQKRSGVIRTETFGPFEVLTHAFSFYESQVNGEMTWNVAASFEIHYAGKPVVIEGVTEPNGTTTSRFERADAVAAMGGTPAALVVHVDQEGSSGLVYVLKDDHGTLRTEFVTSTYQPLDPWELTNDAVQFRADDRQERARGRFDKTLFARPALYRFPGAIVDSRTHNVHHFNVEHASTPISSVRSLGVSPDEQSFVEYAYANGSEKTPTLVVTNFVANSSYEVPIDPERMHFAKMETLDPAWVMHHFMWKRSAGGVDSLAERPGFVPIPWKGDLSDTGENQQSYRIEQAGEEMRKVLMEFLTANFHAERMPAESGAYEYPMKIDGRVVNVANGEEFGYVLVSMANGNKDDGLIARIAKAFDAVLASGKHDGLIGKH